MTVRRYFIMVLCLVWLTWPVVAQRKQIGEARTYLKSGKNSQFIRFMKNHFKSKANCTAVERDPSLFLNVYQDYLHSLKQ